MITRFQLDSVIASAQQASASAAAAAIAAPAKPGAATLAQARLCVELAVSADEAGDASAEETVKLYTASVESYFEVFFKVEDDSIRTAALFTNSCSNKTSAAISC